MRHGWESRKLLLLLLLGSTREKAQTDWDEVTWLHTSGAPSAIPKAKRRPSKSCKHKP